MTRYNVSSQKVTPNSLLYVSVLVVVALVVVEVIHVKNVEYHEYLMVLVKMEGEEVARGQVVVTREEQ